MTRWFRFYADAHRNPKVAKLDDRQFRLWVQLLSIAAENDGLIPPLEDLKHVLNRRLDHLSTGVKGLLSMGLMDSLGDGYRPHSWNKYQYISDTSTKRVTLHRQKRNVSVTPPDTDTDTDTPIPKGIGLSPDYQESSDAKFWREAKAYLGGNNPGALIGKWSRDYGKSETAGAITASQIERAVDPVSYIERCLRGKGGNGKLQESLC